MTTILSADGHAPSVMADGNPFSLSSGLRPRMYRVLAFAALLVGAGLMFGGAMEEVVPIEVVEEASACEDGKCGGCKIRPGDPLGGQLPYIECHN